MGRLSVFVARVWWKEPCKAGPARALEALLLIPSSASMPSETGGSTAGLQKTALQGPGLGGGSL